MFLVNNKNTYKNITVIFNKHYCKKVTVIITKIFLKFYEIFRYVLYINNMWLSYNFYKMILILFFNTFIDNKIDQNFYILNI